MTPAKKILFIYLKTGGGHLAPAKSLSNFYLKNNKNVQPILVDGLEQSGRFAKYIIEDGYRILQSKSKWIYEYIYALHKIKFIAHLSSFLVSLFMKKYLADIISRENPDKIVLFHFFCIKPVYKIIRNNKLGIPVVTVVTDPYIAHPLWILRKDQEFVLFSEKLKNHFVKNGIKESCIKVFPFILDEKFSSPASPDKIDTYKKELGFTKDKVLLILGGGDGIPGGLNIVKKIMKMEGVFETAIVCGKNVELFEEVKKLKEEKKFDNLKVYGFIDFVYELINLSDLVISKCGASTFMEILISNKIPVVNNYLWEQEKGNVDFIIENNLGIYEPKVKKMRKKIGKMLCDESLINYYKNNIRNMSLRNGLPEVAEYLIK